MCKYISILFCSVLFCSVLFCSILFYFILFYSILFYSFYSILFCSILFYSILFYSILFYSILFYSILFYSIQTILLLANVGTWHDILYIGNICNFLTLIKVVKGVPVDPKISFRALAWKCKVIGRSPSLTLSNFTLRFFWCQKKFASTMHKFC